MNPRQSRIDSPQPGEPLYGTIELTNPVTTLAVQIQTTDYYMIGWAPRYLVGDLVQAISEYQGEYAARSSESESSSGTLQAAAID